LAWGWPWLAISEWLPQLAAVISLQRAAGRRLFLVAATTDTQLELQGVIDALAVDRLIVVCLSAGPEAVATRIADREPDAWPGKAPLISHARVLAESIPSIAGIDAVICTEGRSPVDVAGEINVLLRDHDLLPTLISD
jgi:pimeloyl-ACP methyl ester carboxylesterase